ncbi:MAG: spore coat associated protein CotJA [Agathobacter sp.]|nr:spore coat associated protein CotJA [Agathobacter sp.]
MLYGVPLAMGYVPWQSFECTYEPAQALQAGTIFPELDKPFYGRRGVRL